MGDSAKRLHIARRRLAHSFLFDGVTDWGKKIPAELFGLDQLTEEEALGRLCASGLLPVNDLRGLLARLRAGVQPHGEGWRRRRELVRSKWPASKPVLEQLYAK